MITKYTPSDDTASASFRIGLGHMTLVFSGKKFPPMWLRSNACYSEVYRTCGLTALRDLTKASQSLKINLDQGLSEGV
jgi:hypothetical protein